MATQLAVPQERDNLRISQLLPTVKCSDCADAVLLSELAEHVCRPKPSSALLSKRIEDQAKNVRAISPAAHQRRIEPEAKNVVVASPAIRQKHLEADTKSTRAPSPATHQKRPSSNLRAYGNASPAPRIPLPATPGPSSRSTPSPTPSRASSRATSSTHTLSILQSPTSTSPPNPTSTPSLPPSSAQGEAPTILSNRPPLSIHVPPNPSPRIPNPVPQPPTPQMYNFPEPETSAGGEAGMAGVGRRGFAAAARAAMFTANTYGQFNHAQHQSSNHPHTLFQIPSNNSQPNRPTPHHLDISAATLNRPSDTPPSDGDLSSPSPSSSPLPKSPSPQVPLAPVHARTNSSHSSESGRIRALTQEPDTDIGSKLKRPLPPALNLSNLDRAESPGVSSPAVSLAKLPFFEKYKTKLSTPTTPQFPTLPDPLNSTPAEEVKKGTPLANVTTRSRQSSASSSYSFRSSAAAGNQDGAHRQRQLSSASSSSYTSASFSFAPRGEEPAAEETNVREPASPTDSDSECGLAYADDTDYEDETAIEPVATKPVNQSIPGNRVRFPSISSQSSSQSRSRAGSNASSTSGLGQSVAPLRINRRPSDSNGSPFERERTNSSASDRLVSTSKPGLASAMVRARSNSASSTSSKTSASSSYSRATGVGMSMLADKARKEMETVWEDRPLSQIRETSEETAFSSRPAAQRANTVAALPSSPDTRAIKLPVRSKTERESVRTRAISDGPTEPKSSRKKRVKICVRCDKRIEDGRWVDVDSEGKEQGGGVLCERCWKNMYLPKCRRCNLPIETQAVSSSDGQLKGKYHKQCFNCHQCHKPFPDKSFYVFDGKPFCAYHYHEANDSLCAAALCGQPIEGPCAVSHTGDRYHPEHMTCEWPEELGGCAEQLVEYWEIGGRMLCEKHSQGPANAYDVNADAGNRNADKSQKRVTRFIDLAGASSGKQGVGERF